MDLWHKARRSLRWARNPLSTSDLDEPRGSTAVPAEKKDEILPGKRRFAWLRDPRVLIGLAAFVVLAVVAIALGIWVALRKHHQIKPGPVVDLGYCNYTGATVSDDINQWLGMRYAAPPVGDLRFRAPQDPVIDTTARNAYHHGSVCIPTGPHRVSSGYSEDCLFIDVFAPSTARQNANGVGPLPVFVFLQGGGFNADGNANMSGQGLIMAANYSMVVVTFNYRVGPYGFLTSKEVQENGDLNVGLKDQRKALEWVQQHISKFGGNASHVTLGGDSAGAASVVLHLTAYGGKDDGLFHAVAAESPSMGVQFTVNGSQYQYDSLVERTGCHTSADTLACLRDLSLSALQAANVNVPTPGGAGGSPLYMYSNVIDGNFTTDYTYNMLAQGRYIKVPSIYGADANDGTVFVPRELNSTESMNRFLKNQFPLLSATHFSHINAMYPEANHFAGTGPYWRATANAYGDMRYMCPSLYLSDMSHNASLPTWTYLYSVEDPAQLARGLGVPHTVEVNAIWGPQYVNDAAPASYKSPLNAPAITFMQGYWTSFIRTYDPNTYRAEGSPTWEQWSSGSRDRIKLQTNATTMETVDGDQYEKCSYFFSVGPSLQQ
ncbi:MAG: hypothetical protein M1818_003422 [Claussenomyces sp. TS43310]|nr:MAG: hypothetical protein M1818_003422 [Claussenomyces sp. TS43310]